MADYQLYQSPGQAGQQPGGPPPAPPPKPPRQNPYRDGISMSAQHYDLFEMIRHPHASKTNRPPDPPPRPLHPPLSKQKQIELEIEKEFEKNRRRAQGSKIAFLATLVKYLSLVFLLPPYILLYRLPKLLFVDWVVAVANSIDSTLVSIGRAIRAYCEGKKAKIRETFVAFWERIKATFRRKMGRTEQRDEDEELTFLQFLAEGLVGLYRLTLYPIVKATLKGWRLAKWSLQTLRELPQRLHQAVQKMIMRYQTMRNAILEKINLTSRQALEYLQDRTTRPLSRWIDAKIEAAIAFFRRCREVGTRWAKAIAFALRHPIQTLQHAYNLVRYSLNRFSQSLRERLTAKATAIKERLIALRSQCHAWIDRGLFTPLRQVRAKIDGYGRELYAWIKRPFSTAWFVLRQIGATIRTKISLFFKGRLERPLRWMRERAAQGRWIGQQLKALLKAVYKELLAAIVRRVAPLLQIALALLEPFRWALKEFWSLFIPLLDPLVRLYNGTKNRFAAFVLRVRRLIAWTHILLRYGMQVVRQSSFGAR